MSLSKAIAVILLGLIGTSCSIVSVGTTPSASICAGVDAQMGGCDEQQPEFAATGCSEWGVSSEPTRMIGHVRSSRARTL